MVDTCFFFVEWMKFFSCYISFIWRGVYPHFYFFVSLSYFLPYDKMWINSHINNKKMSLMMKMLKQKERCIREKIIISGILLKAFFFVEKKNNFVN